MLNAAASASTPSSASTGATVPTGAPATGWTMSGRLLDDPSASPATRATVEPRTQWTRWTQFAQPFAVATAERTQQTGAAMEGSAARFHTQAMPGKVRARSLAFPPSRWLAWSRLVRCSRLQYGWGLASCHALRNRHLRSWPVRERTTHGLALPAAAERLHLLLARPQATSNDHRGHRQGRPELHQARRRVFQLYLVAQRVFLTPGTARRNFRQALPAKLFRQASALRPCAQNAGAQKNRGAGGSFCHGPRALVARVIARELVGVNVDRETIMTCNQWMAEVTTRHGVYLPRNQKRPPGANQGAPTARVEPCLEAVLNANEVIMPCHVPSASEPKRRRRPSLLKSPPQSPPRIMATLDLSKPIERATHDFLRRASSGRWPMWRLLGAMRREGARLFVAVEWLRSAGESPFCIVELALDQQAVSWQYLPSAKAARAAVATAKPSALVAASAKNRTPHGQ